jgi:hypothetical protein
VRGSWARGPGDVRAVRAFLCDGCGPLAVPPVCASCAVRADVPPAHAGRKMVALLLLGFLLGLPLSAAAIARALGC